MTREIEAPMANLDDRVKDLEELIARMIPAVRTAQASQGVHEFFITHLISHIADMTADRDESLRNIVSGIEISIYDQADQAMKLHGEAAKLAVDNTLEYFEGFKASCCRPRNSNETSVIRGRDG